MKKLQVVNVQEVPILGVFLTQGPLLLRVLCAALDEINGIVKNRNFAHQRGVVIRDNMSNLPITRLILSMLDVVQVETHGIRTKDKLLTP